MTDTLHTTNYPDIKKYIRAETVQNCEECGAAGHSSIFVPNQETGGQRLKVLCRAHWMKMVDNQWETYEQG